MAKANGLICTRRLVTDFRVFADRTILELVRHPERAEELQFLVWQNGKAEIRASFERGGQRFVPPQIDPGLARTIQFPTEVRPYKDVDDLFTEVAAAINAHVKIPLGSLSLVTAYVFATWLTDRFAHAPYLSVFGPLGSGKTQLLQVLSSCCRRPLLLTDISVAGLYSLVNELRLTLLIDEADFGRDQQSRELLRLLRGGHTAGSAIFRAGRIHSLYGPKIVCSREPIRDAALASRSVQIPMSRSAESVPPLEPRRLRWLADALQPKLLMFRLRNYYKPLQLHTELKGLSPRSRDLAHALAAPLAESPRLQESIVDGMRRQEPDVETRHANEPELQALEALFLHCHATRAPFITVGSVTDLLNKILAQRGERTRFDPRAVGPILRQHGFRTEKLGSVGIGVRLTEGAINQLHDRVANYDMTLLGTGLAATCPICADIRKSRVPKGDASPQH